METLQILQSYWWLIIAVLGAALVFLLFVQGGQMLMPCGRFQEEHRQLIVNSIGRKWELTFTTLVTFGGAAFASFPLFYSTSFGGAYWLWMLLLLSFIVQAVSYEFRRKKGNIYGRRFYDALLFVNGLCGVFLLGEAVGMFFFGGDFVVARANVLDASSPVISQWGAAHGFDVIVNPSNALFGFMLVSLALVLGCLYLINSIENTELDSHLRKSLLWVGTVFALAFVATVIVICLTSGLRNGVAEDNVYFNNLIARWYFWAPFLVGVLMVLYGIYRTAFSKTWRCGIWWTGIGVVAVVVVLFEIMAFDGTAYLKSLTHPESSLTLANSSSSLFTLTTMSWVSILVPFVLAYIAYVWYKMNATPLTEDELKSESHQY